MGSFINFGAIITLVGSLIGALAASRGPGKVFTLWKKSFSKESIAVLGIILAASGAVFSSIQQAKSSTALNKKNEQLLRTSQQTMSLLLGGNSYCFVAPTFAQQAGTKRIIGISLKLKHVGDLP
jgi:hypothetical protein